VPKRKCSWRRCARLGHGIFLVVSNASLVENMTPDDSLVAKHDSDERHYLHMADVIDRECDRLINRFTFHRRSERKSSW
jgi:hypothetical protein